jgi:hypothetical protein
VRSLQAVDVGGEHRVRPGEEMVEQHTEAVDVTPGRRVAAAEQLGLQIERRAGERRTFP